MGGGILNIQKDYYDNGKSSSFLGYKKKFVIDDLRKTHPKYVEQNLEFAELSKYKIGQSRFYNKDNPLTKKDKMNANVYHNVSDYEIPADLEKYGDVIPENILNDMALAQKRSVAYHEFGHHVHQTLETSRDRSRYSQKVTETKLGEYYRKASGSDKERKLNAKGRTSLYPSRYAQKNEKEWFAENFSAYHMGRNDLVSPEWLEFYNTEILPNIK